MSQLARPTLSSAKQAVLLALYDHLHSESQQEYLQPREIRDLLTIEVSDKFLALIYGELFESKLIKNTNNALMFKITAKGVQSVERVLRAAVRGTGIPASDRIVSLTDNQAFDLEAAASETLDHLDRENAVDGDPSLKDRLVGQIKAGRELIRAKVLRSFLLYDALHQAILSLIEKYQGKALGEAAKKLLDLLIEHVFKS